MTTAIKSETLKARTRKVRDGWKPVVMVGSLYSGTIDVVHTTTLSAMQHAEDAIKGVELGYPLPF